MIRSLAILAIGAMCASPALADPPPWAGKGKGKGHDKSGWHDKGKGKGKGHARGGGDAAHARYFEDRHRVVVHEYYGSQFRRGHCPPGLAKKNNGCMPPGQAKKWRIGEPLAREVVYYDVPQPLVVQLGAPPAGHRYVRVAGDILLVTVGTALVVDALQDLGRM